MDIVNHIWMEPDEEKRFYLWSHYLNLLETRFRSLELSPAYKSIKSTSEDFEQIIKDYAMFSDFGNQLKGIDFNHFKLTYEKDNHGKQIQTRIEEIEESYFPKLKEKQQNFVLLKDYAYEHTNISSVGIEHLYKNEGLLFIKHNTTSTIHTYRYVNSPVVNKKKRSILHLTFLDTFKESVSTTLFQIKKRLNYKLNTTLNSYLVECNLSLPLKETLVPVAKGKLSRHLNF